MGLDPAPPKIEQNKVNFHDSNLSKKEFGYFNEGKIKQDFTTNKSDDLDKKIVKTEETCEPYQIPIYIRGKNSFPDIFDNLKDD